MTTDLVTPIIIAGLEICDASPFRRHIYGGNSYLIDMHLIDGGVIRGVVNIINSNRNYLTFNPNKDYCVMQPSKLAKKIKPSDTISFDLIERIEIVEFITGNFSFIPVTEFDCKRPPIKLSWRELFTLAFCVDTLYLEDGRIVEFQKCNSLVMQDWAIKVNGEIWRFNNCNRSIQFEKNTIGISHFYFSIDETAVAKMVPVVNF